MISIPFAHHSTIILLFSSSSFFSPHPDVNWEDRKDAMNVVASRTTVSHQLPHEQTPSYPELRQNYCYQNQHSPVVQPLPPPPIQTYGSVQMADMECSSPPSPTVSSPTSPSFLFRSFKSVQHQQRSNHNNYYYNDNNSNNANANVNANGQTAAPSLLKRLPQEVYDCILSYLQLSHTLPNSDGCVTCFMRDLHSLSLTNRAWEKAVRSKLYVCRDSYSFIYLYIYHD